MTDPAEPQSVDEVILAFQADPPKILKSKSGQVGNQKTKYADLVEGHAEVMPRLSAMKTVWKTKPTRLFDLEGAPFVLRYSLRHLPSGTSEDGDFPLRLSENSQQMGSAITYARRYALFAVLGLVAEDEDDDGDATAPGRTVRRSPRQQPAAEPGAPVQRAARPAPSQPPLPGEGAPPPAEPVRGRGGLVTLPMTKKLAVSMQKVLETSDPAVRKQFIVDMIGREVATSKDLTFEEGRGLIDAFEKAKATDNPIGNVIDIYHRVNQAGGPAAEPEPVRERPEPSGRQPGQRSRNAREAVTNGGDEGTEDAPWEGQLPV